MKKVPEIFVVPTEEDFAIEMASIFLKENRLEAKLGRGQTVLDVIFSDAETHGHFTIWLCSYLREMAYEDAKTPKDTAYN